MENKQISIEQLEVGKMKNFCYLVWDPESKDCAVFDPAWEIPRLLELIRTKGLKVKLIVNTHGHFDHVQGNDELKKHTGAKIVMSSRSNSSHEIRVADGEKIDLGKLSFTFVHTPGHSPESMCIILNNVGIITGDTLFIGECGRVDLPGGNASDLYDSLVKLKRLDPDLIVYPGHDYGSKKSASLSEQMENNYTLVDRSREEFIEFMNTP